MATQKNKKTMIIGIIGIALIAGIIYSVMRIDEGKGPLGAFGRVDAVVVGKRGGSRSTLNLSFTTKDGQEGTQTVKVPSDVFAATKVGDRIEVIYDKQDPAKVKLLQ